MPIRAPQAKPIHACTRSGVEPTLASEGTTYCNTSTTRGIPAARSSMRGRRPRGSPARTISTIPPSRGSGWSHCHGHNKCSSGRSQVRASPGTRPRLGGTSSRTTSAPSGHVTNHSTGTTRPRPHMTAATATQTSDQTTRGTSWRNSRSRPVTVAPYERLLPCMGTPCRQRRNLGVRPLLALGSATGSRARQAALLGTGADRAASSSSMLSGGSRGVPTPLPRMAGVSRDVP